MVNVCAGTVTSRAWLACVSHQPRCNSGMVKRPAWSAMKEGFRKAFEDLKEAAHKAREKFH